MEEGGLSMDDMLAGLQAELAAVQLQESAHKLSERNCIELVSKLQALGKLDLLTTFNSVPEFVTQDRLEVEIEQELRQCGGRAALSHLQTVANVDIVHVEAAVQRLIKKRAGGSDTLELLNSTELISRSYVTAVAAELNDVIQQAGQITLAEVSKRFDLPVKYVVANIKPRAGSGPDAEICAEFSGDRFYTAQYVQRNNARVRGILNGVTRVTVLSKLWKDYGLEPKISERYARSLVESGAVRGTIANGELSPAVFAAAQRQQLEAAFELQGYYDVASAKARGVTNLLAFLQPTFPSCRMLGKEFVIDNNRVVQLLQSHLLEFQSQVKQQSQQQQQQQQQQQPQSQPQHPQENVTAFQVASHVIDFDGERGTELLGQFDALLASTDLTAALLDMAFQGLAGAAAGGASSDLVVQSSVCSTTPWQPPPPSAEGTFDPAALSEQSPSMLHIAADTNVVVSAAFFHEVYRVAATEAIRLAEEHCKHLVVESVPSTPATPMEGGGSGGGGGDDEYVIIHTSAPSTPHDFGATATDDKRERGKAKGKGKRGNKKGRAGNEPAAEEESRGSRKGNRKQKGSKKGRGQQQAEQAGNNTGDSGRKGGKKNRKGRRRGDVSSSDDENEGDEPTPSGVSRRSGSSRSRGAAAAAGPAAAAAAATTGRKGSQAFLSRRAFRGLLANSVLQPLCTTTDSGEETAQRLAASLQNTLYSTCLGMYTARCERLRSSVFKAASTDSRRLRQDIDRHFDSAWVEFAASVAGLDGLLKTSRSGAPVFSSGGGAHRQLKRMLARSPVCTNALGLLLCSVGLQLDPTVLPPKVTSAAAASELSVAELRGLAKAIRPLCGPLASSVGEWLAVAQASTGGGGGASSNDRCVCSQGLDDLAASVAAHVDLYIKFPKTSGKILKHFVFKQRAVLAQRITDVNLAALAQEGDKSSPAAAAAAGVSLLLSLVLQFLLATGSGLFVQIELGSQEAREQQLVDALVSAAVSASQEGGAAADEGKEESGDEGGELGSLISRLHRELVCGGETGSHQEGALSSVDALERARQLALELGRK